jgi:hypothetical protein
MLERIMAYSTFMNYEEYKSCSLPPIVAPTLLYENPNTP